MIEVNIHRPNFKLYENLASDGSEADFPAEFMSAERFRQLNDPEAVAELDLPDPVRACVSILRDNGVCHVLTQGDEAYSCADAASKRWFRGVVGIPLINEFKSLVYRSTESETPYYIAVHVSAKDRVDMKSLKSFLKGRKDFPGHKTSPVDDDELAEKLGAQFGTVNPVLLSQYSNVLQVWDEAVRWRFHKPMTTNAGHHNYAIEFMPFELFNELPHEKASHPLTERSQRMAALFNVEDGEDCLEAKPSGMVDIHLRFDLAAYRHQRNAARDL